MQTQSKIYYDVNDIAAMLGISTGMAYKLIRTLNKELSDMGYVVIAGKISSKYFQEKFYGLND